MDRSEYQKYLASREWALLREKVRKRSGGFCEACWIRPMQQCHHLTYERVGHEKLGDLQAICEPCHAWESGKLHKEPSKREFEFWHHSVIEWDDSHWDHDYSVRVNIVMATQYELTVAAAVKMGFLVRSGFVGMIVCSHSGKSDYGAELKKELSGLHMLITVYGNIDGISVQEAHRRLCNSPVAKMLAVEAIEKLADEKVRKFVEEKTT